MSLVKVKYIYIWGHSAMLLWYKNEMQKEKINKLVKDYLNATT